MEQVETEQPEKEIKILGLGGSLRDGSYSLTALKMALDGAGWGGATTEMIDLKELRLPFFQPEQPLEAYPEAAYISEFLDKFKAADGFVWCPPTYHATPSAVFKNALDFLELLPRRPHLYLSGKVAGLIALAGGANAGGEALTSLYYNARSLKLLVVPSSFHLSPAKTLFVDGDIKDEKVIGRIASLGTEVAQLARKLRG